MRAPHKEACPSAEVHNKHLNTAQNVAEQRNWHLDDAVRCPFCSQCRDSDIKAKASSHKQKVQVKASGAAAQNSRHSAQQTVKKAKDGVKAKLAHEDASAGARRNKGPKVKNRNRRWEVGH
jgi:hypothetical protein